MSKLEYKGYSAAIEFSAEDCCFFGKLENIRDLVNFEADTAEGLVAGFHAAVDDYLADCAAKGKTPNQPFKGSFNVRVGSELHRKAAYAAEKRGQNLNKFVAEAIEERISSTV